MLSIFVIGDGGIGSNLSVPLVKFLIYWTQKQDPLVPVDITFCDADKVESSNPMRQYFLPGDEGQPKVNITTDYLCGLLAKMDVYHIDIHSFPYFVKEDNVDIIKDGSIVLCGVDNHITKVMLEKHFEKLENGLLIIGANDYHDGDINVLYRHEGKWETPLLSQKHPEVLKEANKYPDELSCEEGAVSSPQLILSNMTSALGILEVLYAYLETGKIPYHEKFFDNKTGNVRIIK